MNTKERDKLDFCIVGAQKAATTTIYKWLVSHPKVYLPSEKEAPFFSKDELYQLGWNKYLRTFFSKAPLNCLLGTATPQYFGIQRARQRMASMFPNIKLILILRDPIDRAFSHYLMEVRAGRENRSFHNAITNLLTEKSMSSARNIQSESTVKCYITFGEYGYLIKKWFQLFSEEQFLTLFLNEVSDDPNKVYSRICNFLGISSENIPKTLGKKFHQGGASGLLPPTFKLKKFLLFRLLRKLVPDNLYRRFSFWYKVNNVAKTNDDPTMDDLTRNLLIDHYRKDAELYKKVTGYTLPWLWLKQNTENTLK